MGRNNKYGRNKGVKQIKTKIIIIKIIMLKDVKKKIKEIDKVEI